MASLQEIFENDNFYRLTDDDKYTVIERSEPRFGQLSAADKAKAYDKIYSKYKAEPKAAALIDDGLMPAHAQAEPQRPKPEQDRSGIVGAMRGAAEKLSPYYRPVLEGGGAIAGGVLASPGFVTGAAGAGLGYGIGKKAADVADQFAGVRAPGTVTEEVSGSAKDVAVGAVSSAIPIGAALSPAKTAVGGIAKNAIAGGLGYASGEEVEKLYDIQTGDREQTGIGDDLKNAAANVGTGAAMELAGEGVNALASKAIRTGKNVLRAVKPGPANANPTKTTHKINDPRQQAIADADAAGIDSMTSDAFKPRTFLGKSAQAMGERVPFFGTGKQRGKQQQQRIDAIKKVVTDFGASEGAADDVMRNLSEQRKTAIAKHSGLKDGVIKRLDAAGDVPVDKSNAAIDAEIERLTAVSADGYSPVISRLEQFKNDINGKSLVNVEGNRKLLGDAFKPQELANVRSEGEKSVAKVYGALREDMGEFIEASGSLKDRETWASANKELSSMMSELDVGSLKSALKKGDATPEEIRRLLFSKKKSDVELLYKNLPAHGKQNARAAILHEAVEKSGGIDNISPEKFATNVKKLGNSVGIFFNGNDLRKVKGLSRALELTTRAGEFAVHAPTGAQNYPLIGGAVLADTFGTGGAVIASGAAIGGAARLIESKTVRDMLVRLSSTKKGSPKEAMVAGKLFTAIAAANTRHNDDAKEKN